MGSMRCGWRVDSQATMTAVKVITWVLRVDFIARVLGRQPFIISALVLLVLSLFPGTLRGQLIDGMAQERLFADNARRKKANGRRNFLL
ncbi:hypothetical protein CDAR_179241 [Caerostris darwini]|uniref:Uncharacterized protein n=1 Tax=Caerostris darwini TaxID=1538125 RepID=A0AAV4PA50_9ARAC|nr:hypothetical protein CDAR_179241 [Caerostris darwini]